MGIKDTIKNLLFKKKGGIIGTTPDDTLLFKTLRQSLGITSIHGAYSDAVWVYASIKKITDNISSLPIQFFDRKANGENVGEEVFFKDLGDLSRQELIEVTLLSLEVYGEAFWYLERDNITQLPRKIVFLHFKKMQPVFSEGDKIVGWVWDNKVPLMPYEVIRFKYPNPYDERGMSPLTPARIPVQSDFYAGAYNKHFFENGASVGGFIKVDGFLDDKAFKRIINQFNDRHAGVGNAHKIGVLEGGADFKELKTSFRDMEFVELKKLSREEIFAAFGTNPVILGLYEDVKSYEGIKSIHKAFWVETLIPKIARLEGRINKTLKKIEAGRYKAKFDLSNVEALRENIKDKVETAFTLWKMGYPINMINEKLDLGMDEVEWGNEWWIPPTIYPADGELTSPKPENSKSPGKKNEKINLLREMLERNL